MKMIHGSKVVPDPLGEHGPLPDAASDRNRFPAQEAVEVGRCHAINEATA